MEDMTYRLEGIIKSEEDYKDFEGPLNLILMLLSKNKIEIRDIQISLILDQYLEQIEKMQEMDLEVASEFIQMASHLLYLKTRTLLAGEETEISELDALIASLEQLKCRDAYMSIKKITESFDLATRKGLLFQSRPPEPLPKQPYSYKHEPAELLAAIAAMFSRGGVVAEDIVRQQVIPKKIVYGVRTKSEEILALLKDAPELSMRKLFADSKSRSEVVATFISILEMCSVGGLMITETENDYVISLTGVHDAEHLLERIEARHEEENNDGNQ